MVLRQSGGMDENNRRSNFVRQRLSWFVDILFSYVLESVIQPATAEMRAKMSDADDIDAMISTHEAFISKLQTRCLLSKNLAPIHDTLISLLDLALSYTDNQFRRLNRQTAKSRFQSADRRRKRAVPRRESPDELSSDEDEGEDDDDYDADNETPSSRNDSYEERLVRIQEQFGQSLGFAVAGLKGVSRVGGEGAWEMLAERLEWGLSRVNA
jgi:gamma-tubulin complex component 5